MSAEPAIGVAKRVGQLLIPQDINDETGGSQEEFWAVTTQAVVSGNVLCKNITNPRLVTLAFGVVGAGSLQIVCGVALTDAAAGEKVKILRRGIHPGVIYDVAGSAGSAAMVEATAPGRATPITGGTVTAAHLMVGIQLETAVASPVLLKASTFVSAYF